jgi:hypothetical protein
VPEPASIVLLLVGSAAVIGRPKRMPRAIVRRASSRRPIAY